MSEEFYIGWQAKAPVATGRVVRRTVIALLVVALAVAGGVAISQRTIGSAVFEWGQVKEFSGILRSEPVPHLLVTGADAPASFTNFYLVNPLKAGFNVELARRFDGQRVSLRGTLIYRGEQRMVEVVRDSVHALLEGRLPQVPDHFSEMGTRGVRPSNDTVNLGERTFVGEIVDSKCWLGVMNPGRLKPHRACAIRCISGGIPPVLLVRQADGSALHLLLVGRDSEPVNQAVLPLVAVPVEIKGELVRQGEILTLRADPATYRRL